MRNWKKYFDDEGRSFVEFLREENGDLICVACNQKISNENDELDVIQQHNRTIEHGFRLFIMFNLAIETIDLTTCQDRENLSPAPTETNVEISRNADGTLKIDGLNPIKYIVPISDLKFITNGTYASPRKTVFNNSIENYLVKERSPTKRKIDQEENEVTQLFLKKIILVTVRLLDNY